MRISDWSSDVCSSDLQLHAVAGRADFLVDLEAALELLAVELHERAVRSQVKLLRVLVEETCCVFRRALARHQRRDVEGPDEANASECAEQAAPSTTPHLLGYAYAAGAGGSRLPTL